MPYTYEEYMKAFANLPKNFQVEAMKNMNYHLDVVTLMVDTSKIPKSNNELSKDEIDKYCKFVHLDYQGGKLTWIEERANNEDYEIKVNPDDMVIWNGIPKDKTMTFKPGQKGGYSVRITEIDWEDGQNLFGSKYLFPKSSKYPSVQGTVRKDVSKIDQMSYIIKFEVYNGEKLHGTYKIDPKISIKPTQGGQT